MRLTTQHCEACQAGAPQVSDSEMADLMTEIPDWQPIAKDAVMMLTKQYRFRTFKQALAFTNQVGAMAEDEGHHPEIITEWGAVRVTWWTHAIGGLHKNDFICAAKTDALMS